MLIDIDVEYDGLLERTDGEERLKALGEMFRLQWMVRLRLP